MALSLSCALGKSEFNWKKCLQKEDWHGLQERNQKTLKISTSGSG